MISDDNRLEKLRQSAAKVAQKQSLLEAELSQCLNYPQPGDIFVFAHPETLGLQWVILDFDKKQPQRLLTVPADDVAMVGSSDIELPEQALCSPLTLRCRQSLWIHAENFDKNLRVGLLETWHRLRALEKVKQIADSKLISSVLQQQMDIEPDYQEWMTQVNKGQQALEQSLKQNSQVELSWYEKIGFWIKETLVSLKQKKPAWTWQLGWATAVVVLAIVVYIIFAPNNPIDTSYQIVVANKTVEMEKQLHELQFQWETTAANVHGFSSAKPPSVANKAFAAGLVTGKNLLLDKNRDVTLPTPLLPSNPEGDWLTTEMWQNYFELGRWTMLLWTVSQFQHNRGKPFWDEQRQILTQLQTAFKVQQITDSEAKIVLAKLEQLEPLLQKLSDANALPDYYKLWRQLEIMMEHLALATF